MVQCAPYRSRSTGSPTCTGVSVFAQRERTLTLVLDVQVDAVVAPKRQTRRGIAEARETLAAPLLESLSA